MHMHSFAWMVKEVANCFGYTGFVLVSITTSPSQSGGRDYYLGRDGVVRTFSIPGEALVSPHWQKYSEAQEFLHNLYDRDTYVKPKPPLGVIPREQWREGTVRDRVNELKRAICEYIQAELITDEMGGWIEELHDRVADLAILMDKAKANKRK